MRNKNKHKRITQRGIHVFLVPARSGKELWQEKQRKEVPSLIRLVFENPELICSQHSYFLWRKKGTVGNWRGCMILRKGADDSSPCGLKVWVRGGVVLGSIGWCRDPGGVEGTASGSSRGGARPCPPLLPRHRAHLASAEPTPTALQSEQQTEKNRLVSLQV